MHLKYQRKKFTHTQTETNTRTNTHTRIQKHIQTHIQISTCRHTLSTFGKLASNIQLTPAVSFFLSFFLSLFLSHSLILPHHPLSHFLPPPLPFTSLSAPLLSRHLPIQCLPPHTAFALLPLLITLYLPLLASLCLSLLAPLFLSPPASYTRFAYYDFSLVVPLSRAILHIYIFMNISQLHVVIVVAPVVVVVHAPRTRNTRLLYAHTLICSASVCERESGKGNERQC